jgi:predicted dehydrogenase
MSKIRIAILGCGNKAHDHARCFLNHSEATIVALCDVTEDLPRALIRDCFSGETPPEIFTDAASMYAAIKPDAVAIVTPHTLHFEHGMQALNAGCHVLMEKPMVTELPHARQLAERIRQSDRVFTIGYNTPCTPAFRYLRDLIRSSELGRLQTVSGWLAQDWKRITTGKWRQNPALSGGGELYDSGAHLLNSLLWPVDQPLAEVSAFIDNSDTAVDVNGIINIRFAEGALASLTIAGNCSNEGAAMSFAFENGRVDIDGWNGTWIKVFRRGSGEIHDLPLDAHRQQPGDNFINTILGRDELLTTVEHGVRHSELMDAIYESAQTGNIVRF